MNDDRRRLADRLHDGPLQSLTAAQLQLDALALHRDRLPREVGPIVAALQTAVGSASRECRTIMDELVADA